MRLGMLHHAENVLSLGPYSTVLPRKAHHLDQTLCVCVLVYVRCLGFNNNLAGCKCAKLFEKQIGFLKLYGK